MVKVEHQNFPRKDLNSRKLEEIRKKYLNWSFKYLK